MKARELIGARLDYWVARAEGLEEPTIEDGGKIVCTYVHHHEPGDDGWWTEYRPSTDWAVGGPIIERERIMILSYVHPDEYEWDGTGSHANLTAPARWWASTTNQNYDGLDGWVEVCPQDDDIGVGGTPLIAAMRAYVASKFGDEFEDATRP